MMSSNKKKIIIAVAAIVVCASAAFGITVACLNHKYEKEIAAVAVLEHNGVTPDEFGEIVALTKYLDKNITADNFFALAEGLQDVDETALGKAMYAYQNPSGVKNKSVLSCIDYYKALKNNLPEGGKPGGTSDRDLPKLSERQWINVFASVKAVATGVSRKGKWGLVEFVAGVALIGNTDDIWTKVPYKVIYNTCKYAVDVTVDVDLADLDFGDAIFGEGFYDIAVAGIMPLAPIIRSMTFEDFADLVGNLPDTTAFYSAVVKKFFPNGVGIEEFAKSAEYIVKNLLKMEVDWTAEDLVKLLKEWENAKSEV